ncbi:hypothetical protein GL300_18580 [Paracoccus litorisediminis]|uniref:DUF2570 domain-containing protein n=2 Tax=Paracoccus litorisediminis TaxID=2006130 RepID=A0A844HUH5_9RHOB|nr:hypothetical protein [Paracoccus litorisediminis]
MRDIFLILAVCAFSALVGFHEGKSRAEAAHQRAVAEVAVKAQEATQRLSQALADTSTTLAAKDAELANLTEQLNEANEPDTCAVPAGKLLRLDAIR